LGQTGELLIELVDASGQAMRGELWTHLIESDAPDSLAAGGSRGMLKHMLQRRPSTADGRALYRHVGLELKFEVRAGLRNGGGFSSMLIDGPRVAGEQIVARVVLDEKHPILRGRLVNPAGIPLASYSFVLSFYSEGLREREFHTATDAEGDWSLHLDLEERSVFEGQWMDCAPSDPLERTAARLRLPADLWNGFYDPGS
jgi:hypothetical protein